MRPAVRFTTLAATLLFSMNLASQSAEAGLFKKLFGCGKEDTCEPVCCEPVCCEPEVPVCCEPEPVCCEAPPEPTCCEPVEPCCEPAPAPCCSSLIPPPQLAPGEKLVSIGPAVIKRSIPYAPPADTSLVSAPSTGGQSN